jgi:hypothetical protein
VFYGKPGAGFEALLRGGDHRSHLEDDREDSPDEDHVVDENDDRQNCRCESRSHRRASLRHGRLRRQRSLVLSLAIAARRSGEANISERDSRIGSSA